MEKVAIGITTYIRKDNNIRVGIFKECVTSLLDSGYTGKIFIVDDGSETQEHIEWVKTLSNSKITCYMKEGNGGIARAKNSCLRLMYEDENIEYGFIADDDVVFTGDWCSLYVNAIINSGMQHFSFSAPEFTRSNSREQLVNGFNVLRTGEVNGCFLATTRKLISEVGYFKIFPYKYGHEHTNFSKRCSLKQKGFFDVIGSDKHIKLNVKSHDNSSIIIDVEGVRKNQQHLEDLTKHGCIE